MPSRNTKLKDLFSEKRECVAHFPDWLLSGQDIRRLKSLSRLAVVEMAGRDSVAAAIQGAKEEGLTDLLPTYVYTGTEYGAWALVQEAVHRLSKSLPEIRVHHLVVLGSPKFWHALNGRFAGVLISKYGFYAPCVGCHLYLHSVRIPLALMLGGVPVISGERERHDVSIKINQIPEALFHYQNLAKEFGVRLLFPIRHIEAGRDIEHILGFPWDQGKKQMGCVLSGNDQTLDKSTGIERAQVKTFLDEFALPLTREIIQTYVQGKIPDHPALAADVLVPGP